MQSALKWLSLFILLYLAFPLLLIAFGVGIFDPTKPSDYLLALFLFFPGSLMLVTSYRQITQPRPKLVISCFIASFIYFAAAILFWLRFHDDYLALKDRFTESLNSDMAEIVFPDIHTNELLNWVVIHLLLLLIPLYSNITRYRKENQPVTNP